MKLELLPILGVAFQYIECSVNETLMIMLAYPVQIITITANHRINKYY